MSKIDWNRERVARHLFEIMNKDRWIGGQLGEQEAWKYYVSHGWDTGYLRLADEIVSKGYKP